MDKNLTIRIIGKGPTYDVTAETDDSSASGQLQLPAGFADFGSIAAAVGALRAVERETQAPASPHEDPRALGLQLFESLFAGKIGMLLLQALGTAEKGVRVRLNITANEDTSALAALPWEILTPNFGVNDTPLAFGKNTVLVRAIDVTDETRPQPFAPPLRILFVASNPKNTTPLNLAREKEEITKSFGDLRGVVFDTPRNATREAIQEALSDASKTYHVVHFMGHGDFDPVTGRGAVLLENEDGTANRVEGDVLRVILERARPQLVFLNACKTATTSAAGVVNPFGGVAAALLAGGIPAVLAMQFPISDKAAIKFATTFYKRLVQGLPVDSAVAEARALLFDGTDVEWATPVLYLRPRHGVLFEVAQSSAPSLNASTNASTNATTNAGAIADETTSRNAASAAETSSEKRFTVFLAASSQEISVRGQVIKGLRAAGIDVLPSVPDPDTPEESECAGHDARIRELAPNADLFVHILGADRGVPLSDADTAAGDLPNSAAMRQVALGAQLLRPQLILIDSASTVLESISDMQYREFLQRLQNSERERGELEFRSERLTQATAAIVDRRDRMIAERARAASAARNANAQASNATAYVDLHADDYDQAQDLLDYLETRGIKTVVRPVAGNAAGTSAPAGNPAQAEERFKNFVRSAPLVILFYGRVGYDWVSSRFEMMMKLKATEKLHTRFAVYVAAPAKNADDLLFADQLPTANNANGFDRASVDALLDGGRK